MYNFDYALSKVFWFEKKQNTVTVSDAEPVTEKVATTNIEVKDVKINIEPPIAINNFKPINKEVITAAVVAEEDEDNAAGVVDEKKESNTTAIVGKVDKSNLNNETKNINSQEFVTMISDIPIVEDKPISIMSDEKKIVTEEPVKKIVKKQKGPQGILYRAYMSIQNLDEQAPIIVDIIEQLSGEKAGNKRLGYLKPKGRRFHFKLPLNNREQLFEQLKAYGRVKVDKEKHWRKMPEGESRVILWVEDLDLKAERERSR